MRTRQRHSDSVSPYQTCMHHMPRSTSKGVLFRCQGETRRAGGKGWVHSRAEQGRRRGSRVLCRKVKTNQTGSGRDTKSLAATYHCILDILHLHSLVHPPPIPLCRAVYISSLTTRSSRCDSSTVDYTTRASFSLRIRARTRNGNDKTQHRIATP